MASSCLSEFPEQITKKIRYRVFDFSEVQNHDVSCLLLLHSFDYNLTELFGTDALPFFCHSAIFVSFFSTKSPRLQVTKFLLFSLIKWISSCLCAFVAQNNLQN